MTDQPASSSAPGDFRPPSGLPPQGSGFPAPHGQQPGYGQPAGPYAAAYGAPGQQYGQQYGQQHGQQYGQQYGPYNAYGQPAYYGMPAAPKGLSIASLCCGIATLLGCGFLLLPQVAAVVLGHMALAREPAGRSMAIAGLVMGYLGIALAVLAIVFLFLFVAGSGGYRV